MNVRKNQLNFQEKFSKTLRDKGLRATPQRIAVNSAMMSLGHASADMVCEYLVAQGLKVTVASVYNILTQFSSMGIYGVRMSPGNKMFFDYRPDEHLHLYDTVNGVFMDVGDDELMRDIANRVRSLRIKGYKLDYVDVQLVCHSTARKKKD